ncbi:MAG: nucleotidyl transferase AbiEii/AbiGii toxin family protein, partial [Bacteroidales bacterium]|nr:nucleotidyl transferase AbiEii/AbiGii toxin family protein [Bacteroidales bacterium]
GIDYGSHAPQSLCIVPPPDLLPLWEADYRTMQEGFIYGESPSFKELIAAISRIQETLHGMQV